VILWVGWGSLVSDALLRRWYGFVKSRPCLACGARGSGLLPVEAAHVRVVVSFKTGDLLPRSHKGRAAWGCVPLCRRCHLEQHEVGERRFFEDVPRLGERWGSLLLEFFRGGEDGGDSWGPVTDSVLDD
jgi:hypothetical protein